jgi:hypothetical protein
MASRPARIVSGDVAVRRRSLAPSVRPQCSKHSTSMNDFKKAVLILLIGSIVTGLAAFALGNRWIYVDTIISSSGTVVNLDTVSVIGLRTEGSKSWWRLQNTFNPSIAATQFLLSNDSVFSLQQTETPSGPGSIVSLEYISSPTSDTSFYHSIFDADVLILKAVTRLNAQFLTPAGSFDNCAVFMYEIYPEHYREIESPGIGILSCEVHKDSTERYGPGAHRKLTLVSYTLSQ